MSENSNVVLAFETDNHDDGTCYIGGAGTELPQGRVSDGSLLLALDGEDPRKVTYIMGSVKKGWHVACKGTSRFTKGPVRGELRRAE